MEPRAGNNCGTVAYICLIVPSFVLPI